MEYINIMEAARRCQVSDKTIRRAIHSGKLAAKYLKHNQCEIAVSDLEAWHELSADQNERRIAALEQHIATLEQRIAALEEARPAQSRGEAQKRRDLVSLDRFIASHGLTHLDYQRAVNAGALRPPEEVKQKQEDGSVITVQCLDSQARHEFYQALHHSVPTWISCPICPHELV